MRITVGGRGENVRPAAWPPISAVSSSLTILTTCWPGLSWRCTSTPSARSRTLAVNCLTTLKLTSASSSARRISRIAALMSSSVSAPRLRTPDSVPWSFSARESNTASHSTAQRQPRPEQRPGAGRARDLELAAERLDAVGEAAQARAAALVGAAGAVVGDLDQRLAVEQAHVDAHAL